jgi:hypothetical protein
MNQNLDRIYMPSLFENEELNIPMSSILDEPQVNNFQINDLNLQFNLPLNNNNSNIQRQYAIPDEYSQKLLLEERLSKLEQYPEQYLEYLSSSYINLNIIKDIDDPVKLENLPFGINNKLYNDDKIYNYLLKKNLHNYKEWPEKYPNIWSAINNKILNNYNLDKLVKLSNYIHFDIDYDINLLNDYTDIINYLISDYGFITDEIDKRKVYTNMLCLYIEESFKRKTQHYVSIIDKCLEILNNNNRLLNDKPFKTIIYYCLYNKYYNDEIKLRIDELLKNQHKYLEDIIRDFDYKIDIKDKYYTKKILLNEFKYDIKLDLNKEVEFYDMMFNNHYDINELFKYIIGDSVITSDFNNGIDSYAIYYGIKKMYEMELYDKIDKIKNIKNMCVYLNILDFNNLNEYDIKFLIENILNKQYFNFHLIHKICENSKLIINSSNNEEDIHYFTHLILNYLENHYNDIIKIYNEKYPYYGYCYHILFDDLYFKSCRAKFLLYINKNYEEKIKENYNYINLLFHHKNQNKYLDEIKNKLKTTEIANLIFEYHSLE